MPQRILTRSEAESIRNASLLIRRAGYDEKANLLDNLLNATDSDGVVIDTDITNTTTAGYTYQDKRPRVALNENLFLPRPTPNDVVGPTDARIIGLAGTLHHELNHILCRDEIGAFNGEVVFYERINADMNRAFPDGLSAEERLRIEEQKRRWRQDANRLGRAITRRGGSGYGERPLPMRPGRPFPPVPSGPSPLLPGRPFPPTTPPATPGPNGDSETLRHPPSDGRGRLFVLANDDTYPPFPGTRDGMLLVQLGDCLMSLFRRTGSFPPSGNRNLVEALSKAGLDVSAYVNQEGEIVDENGVRFVYRNPGVFDAFGFPDLYTLRPGCSPEHAESGDELIVDQFTHWFRR